LIKIEQAICDSHSKERLHEESLAVSRIKSDPNFFFRYAKRFSICKSDIGPLLNPQSQVLSDDKLEMCRILMDQFNSVFTTPLPHRQIHDPIEFFSCQSIPVNNINLHMTDITISEPIIMEAIAELSVNSAAGPDGFPTSLLLNCASELAPALNIIFSRSLAQGFIPPCFKRAAIVPVFKSGDKTSPSNYRPISLTSIIMKVFERIVRKQIMSFLIKQGHLNDSQHGFRSGRSCLSALLNVFDNLMHMLDGKSTVDMVYLDFSKAFDKVDHGILLHKIRDLGITGNLGIWLFHFLSDRSHFVRLPGGVSQESPVLSGVPQGTVLGPLLFLIMISDINTNVESSSLISFADDTRLYHNIQSTEDCDNLQVDLNTIYDWATCNNMYFNPNKFNYIAFSSSLNCTRSNVYTNPNFDIIPPSVNVKDLGVFMSADCSFNFHISDLTKRCSNLSGWILRTFKTRDSLTMMTLFKSLILSRLDYGSQLWSPHLVKHISQIERIQRSFTKHIAGMHDLEYKDRLSCLKLYSLQRRRERYCIIYIFKIIEGLVPNLSSPIVCSFSDRRGRSCIMSHVNTGRAGTVVFNSFRWRSIRIFNALPKYLRCITSCSVQCFKGQLDHYLSNIDDLPCQPGFNNSLDGGDCIQRRTPRDGLASK